MADGRNSPQEQTDQDFAMQWANETIPSWRNVLDLIRRIRKEEREACAKIAETWGNAPPNPHGRRAELAAAIRQRKP